MTPIATFEKVSLNQYIKDRFGTLDLEPSQYESVTKEWENIKLPTRATEGSAGYDFYAPTWIFAGDKQEKLPTGIRVKIEPGWVLMLFPRSSYGFTYGMRLVNTVGIIDSDYYNASNEGHIMAKFRTDDMWLQIKTGDRFMQGVFVPFGIATNDEIINKERTGGFGSTGT